MVVARAVTARRTRVRFPPAPRTNERTNERRGVLAKERSVFSKPRRATLRRGFFVLAVSSSSPGGMPALRRRPCQDALLTRREHRQRHWPRHESGGARVPPARGYTRPYLHGS